MQKHKGMLILANLMQISKTLKGPKIKSVRHNGKLKPQKLAFKQLMKYMKKPIITKNQ